MDVTYNNSSLQLHKDGPDFYCESFTDIAKLQVVSLVRFDSENKWVLTIISVEAGKPTQEITFIRVNESPVGGYKPMGKYIKQGLTEYAYVSTT